MNSLHQKTIFISPWPPEGNLIHVWGHVWGQVFNLDILWSIGYESFVARPLRIEYDGAVYHITSRGNERKPIFRDDKDRQLFLDVLTEVNRRYHWLCHAYCLMNNHYHMVVETPDGNLSKGMRQREVADYLGMHYSTISRLIRNESISKTRPDPQTREGEP